MAQNPPELGPFEPAPAHTPNPYRQPESMAEPVAGGDNAPMSDRGRRCPRDWWAVVKRDCPTCELVAPVLADLRERAGLTVITQDDPDFPVSADWVVHDADLALSWHHGIETVPTLIRVADGGRGPSAPWAGRARSGRGWPAWPGWVPASPTTGPAAGL